MRTFLKKYQYFIMAVFLIAAIMIAAFFSTGYFAESPAQSGASVLESLVLDDMAESDVSDITATEFIYEIDNDYATPSTQPDIYSEISEETVSNVQTAPQSTSSVVVSNRTTIQSENVEQPNQNNQMTCTFSISCETVWSNMDKLKQNKADILPSDGWIQHPITVFFHDGESVFDVLRRICMENGIHLEFSQVPSYHSVYIEGIYNLYEFDCGSLSGWAYSVNGVFPNYSCSSYSLRDGDIVSWQYTCSYGTDIGGRNALD